MNAEQITFPKPPRVPSDYLFMLTYTAGPEQTRGEAICEELGLCDGATQADELS